MRRNGQWLAISFATLVVACGTARPHVRRICPPLARVGEARTFSIATNVLLECNTGPISEEEVLAALQAAVTQRMPQLSYVPGAPSDLHLIFTLTDYVPEAFDCKHPRWHWTGAVDTWVPVPGAVPPQVTFVALAEIKGTNRVGANDYARDFAASLARIAAKPSAVGPSSVRCLSDPWYPAESSRKSRGSAGRFH